MSTAGASAQHNPSSPGRRGPGRVGVWTATGIGIVAVGLTLTIAELIAALGAWLDVLAPESSPFSALGAAFIAVTPGWLKDVGIGLFGQNDKFALAVSMIVTFIILGVAIGLVGRVNRLAAAIVGAVLTVVTGIAIVTRPEVGAGAVASIALGGVVGIWFLMRVLRPVDGPRDDPRARPVVPEEGAAVSGGNTTGNTAGDRSRRSARPIARRRVLQMTGVGAAVAIVAGGLSRLVPSIADVQANRATVRLPKVGSGSARPAPGSTLGGTSTTSGTTQSTTARSLPSSVTPSSLTPAPSPALPALPANVNPPVPGITPYITPNKNFYRVDTAFTLPKVTTDAWRLKIHGMVDEPFEITWAELLAMPQIQKTITMACVSNPVGGHLAGNAVWQGVRIRELLARAKPQRGADALYTTSADHFSVVTPLGAFTDGRDALLAIGMNGEPLPIEHGFPARIVVPGLYGYVANTKWVEDIEVTQFSTVTGYWTPRGWSARGPIKIASRIDTPGYHATVPTGTVPIAGVAWAPTRGIKKVEVQIDDGPWQAAAVSGVANDDTWRQWVYRWNTQAATPGDHTIRCRATDGHGRTQTANHAPPAPDGASGYDETPVTVT